MLFLTVLLGGCVPHAPPPAPLAAPEPAATAAPPPVSFAPLEERATALLTDADETDRRDRLNLARELMLAMRNKEPAAQKRVYDYLDQLLAIEARSQPQPIQMEGFGGQVQEESLEAPVAPTPAAPAGPVGLDAARAALAEARYLDAVAALTDLVAPEAAALRKEAVDGWARAERERAGHLYLSARQLGEGAARVAALREARAALAAINARFPDNSYAAQIAENVARVDADLAAAGARP